MMYYININSGSSHILSSVLVPIPEMEFCRSRESPRGCTWEECLKTTSSNVIIRVLRVCVVGFFGGGECGIGERMCRKQYQRS